MQQSTEPLHTQTQTHTHLFGALHLGASPDSGVPTTDHSSDVHAGDSPSSCPHPALQAFADHVEEQTQHLLSDQKYGGVLQIKAILQKFEDKFDTTFKLMEMLRDKTQPDTLEHAANLISSVQQQSPTAHQLATELLPVIQSMVQTPPGEASTEESATGNSGTDADGSATNQTTKKPIRTRTSTGQTQYKLAQQLVCENWPSPDWDAAVRKHVFHAMYNHADIGGMLTSWLTANGFTGRNPAHKGGEFNKTFRAEYGPQLKAAFPELDTVFEQLKGTLAPEDLNEKAAQLASMAAASLKARQQSHA